jgi:hypothetical protein
MQQGLCPATTGGLCEIGYFGYVHDGNLRRDGILPSRDRRLGVALVSRATA